MVIPNSALRMESGTPLEPTPPEDVIWLAGELLADPVQGALIRRLGIHGDWTQEEWDGLETFITAKVATVGWVRRSPNTLSLAIAFARRVAVGQFDPPDSDAAKDWIAFNTEDSRQYPGRIHTPPPHLDEMLHFARLVWNDPEINALICSLELKPKWSEWSDEELLRFRIFENNYQLKYGMLNRRAFAMAIILSRRVIRGTYSSVDSDEAIEYLKLYQNDPRLKSVRLEGICNV